MSHFTSHRRNSCGGRGPRGSRTACGGWSSALAVLLAGQVLCGLAGCRGMSLRTDTHDPPPSSSIPQASFRLTGSSVSSGAMAAMKAGRQEYLAGRPERALAELARARQLDSRPEILLPALELTARIQFDRGDRAAAQGTLQELVLAAGGRADWLNLAGRSLLHAGAPALAVPPLRQAVALRPRESRFSRDLAVALLQLDHPREAGDLLAQASLLAPHDAELAAVAQRIRDLHQSSAPEPSAVQVAGYQQSLLLATDAEQLLSGIPESGSPAFEGLPAIRASSQGSATGADTTTGGDVVASDSSRDSLALPLITPRRGYPRHRDRVDEAPAPRLPAEQHIPQAVPVARSMHHLPSLPVIVPRGQVRPMVEGLTAASEAPPAAPPRAAPAGPQSAPQPGVRPLPAAERQSPDPPPAPSRTLQLPDTLKVTDVEEELRKVIARSIENSNSEPASTTPRWHRRARRQPVEAPKPAVHWFPPRATAAIEPPAPR